MMVKTSSNKIMLKTIMSFLKNIFSNKKEDPGKGFIEDPIDYRDIPLEALSKETRAIPKEYNLPFKMAIKNQGNKPHCVGYACATVKEFLEQKEQNKIEFDGDWLYRECKKIDNYDGPGTYFRIAFKILKNVGAKPIKGNEDPAKFRIGGYAKVKPKFDTLKEAIYRYGPLLVGFKGSNEGWKNAYIRPPRSGERIWGHAVALAVGYTKEHIIIQNSWGTKKGDEGFFYFNKDYLPISAHVVLVDLPNNWKELLGKDKTKPTYFFTRNLSVGIKGNDVKALQNFYKYIGCMNSKIDSTGYFGPITKNATKCYQMRKNIQPVSGYFGILTRTAMNKDLNSTGKL